MTDRKAIPLFEDPDKLHQRLDEEVVMPEFYREHEERRYPPGWFVGPMAVAAALIVVGVVVWVAS